MTPMPPAAQWHSVRPFWMYSLYQSGAKLAPAASPSPHGHGVSLRIVRPSPAWPLYLQPSKNLRRARRIPVYNEIFHEYLQPCNEGLYKDNLNVIFSWNFEAYRNSETLGWKCIVRLTASNAGIHFVGVTSVSFDCVTLCPREAFTIDWIPVTECLKWSGARIWHWCPLPLA